MCPKPSCSEACRSCQAAAERSASVERSAPPKRRRSKEDAE